MAKKQASILLDRRRSRWELWFESRPIAHGASYEDIQRWGTEHGYDVLGPSAAEIEEALSYA